jgi:murein DD-endopeptidase MepM/ murein hydrolase activator NlpD
MWPIRGPITSGFGMRWGRMHSGIDIGGPIGMPIHAAKSGTVITSSWMGGYGNAVVISHGGGFSTLYGHQSRIAVHDGQSVSQGETIGYVGSTGNSTGPHLHFETRVNGTPQNPRNFLH